MSEDIVQLPPDSTGKKIRAIKKTVGAHDVYMEGTVPYDELGIGLFGKGGAGRGALRDIQTSFPNLYPPIRSDKPVLSGTVAEWDEGDVHSGTAFRDRDGKYWMYYNSYNTPAADHGIGVAESPDGFVFTKNGANPLLLPVPGTWEADDLFKHCTLKFAATDPPVFRMWYTGWAAGTSAFGYATSPDGIVWTKDAGNPVLEPSDTGWDSAWVSDFRVAYDNYTGIFYGLYAARGADIKGAAIGLATSPDGVTWTKYSGNPVMKALPTSWEGSNISPKCLIKKGSNWILFYEGHSENNWWLNGIAYSTDLINWWHDPRNPVLGLGYVGDFDEHFVSDPSVVIDEFSPDVLRMYYGTYDAANDGFMGLALFPLSPKISGYFKTDWNSWNARVLGGAETSDMVTCGGYRSKTLHFLSDTANDVTIEHRAPDGDWVTLGTQAVGVDTPVAYTLSDDIDAVRISFPEAATITAWWAFTA